MSKESVENIHSALESYNNNIECASKYGFTLPCSLYEIIIMNWFKLHQSASINLHNECTCIIIQLFMIILIIIM